MRKFGTLFIILFFIPFGLFAKGGDNNSLETSSFVDEYNNTHYTGSFIDQNMGTPLIEDFLKKYHGTSIPVTELWNIESLKEELEDAIMDNLEVYFGDPSLTGIMFLGLMGGLEEGIPILEDFTYSAPGVGTQKPLDIMDFDMGLKMKAASDYSSLTATMSMSFEYILRDWELDDIYIQFDGGSAIFSIEMIMDFTSEQVSFRIDGSSQNYHVLDTPYGGVKLHTVSVLSEKGKYQEGMQFNVSVPLFYSVYTNSGDNMFSGNLVLTGDDSSDASFFDILSQLGISD